MREDVQNIIKSFYCFCFGYIRTKDGHIFFMRLICGIIQGCPLSGSVFALLSDPLLERIEHELRHCEKGNMAQACADDIGLVLSKLSNLEVVYNCFKQIQTAAGLTLKPSKCNIVLCQGLIDSAVFKAKR